MSGRLRYGIVALARTDRRLMDVTLQSIARLRDAPDAVALVVPAVREHLFAGAASAAEGAQPLQVITADGFDTLALSEGFRTLAPDVDVILFVPEGVMLDPDDLVGVRATAERWQDLVGELDLVARAVDLEHLTGGARRPAEPVLPRLLRARTLCASTLWVRVEACGNLGFGAFPHYAEYLGFSALLDQLRPRGRTRIVTSAHTVQVRLGSERRSGFEAGRELYGALNRLAEQRKRTDVAFSPSQSYLDPRAEKLRLFVEQTLRYLTVPAARAHVGSFIQGMWAARHDAVMSRARIRQDLRRLR